MNFYKRAKITHMPIVSEQFPQIQFRKKKKNNFNDKIIISMNDLDLYISVYNAAL